MTLDERRWLQIENAFQVLADWQRFRGRPLDAVLDEVRADEPLDVTAARHTILQVRAEQITPVAGPQTASEIVDASISSLDGRGIEILRDRFFADKPEKLDDIGARMGVTRERVRQLEVKALESARTMPEIVSALSLPTSAFDSSQLVAPLDDVLSMAPALAELVPSVQQPLWRVLDRLDDTFEVADGWWCRNTVREAVAATRDEIVDVAGGRRTLPLSELPSLAGQLWAAEWVTYCGLGVLEDFVLLASKGVADRASIVLEIEGSPLTLADIVRRIGSNRTEGSVRNALAVDERFTRVDRGSWALATWGLASYQSIRQLVANELDANGGSMRLSKLVSTLTTRFTISSSSVITYAGGYPFITVDGMVEYASKTPGVRRKQPIDTRRVFRHATGWALRVGVTRDHIRGSGYSLPGALATVLGVTHGEAVTRPSRLGDQRFSWTGAQLSIGSVKRFLDSDNPSVGDDYFMLFGDDGSFDLARAEIPVAPGKDRAFALCGLHLNEGEAKLSRVASAIGAPDYSHLHQVAERLRARGDFDVADAVLAAEW